MKPRSVRKHIEDLALALAGRFGASAALTTRPYSPSGAPRAQRLAEVKVTLPDGDLLVRWSRLGNNATHAVTLLLALLLERAKQRRDELTAAIGRGM